MIEVETKLETNGWGPLVETMLVERTDSRTVVKLAPGTSHRCMVLQGYIGAGSLSSAASLLIAEHSKHFAMVLQTEVVTAHQFALLSSSMQTGTYLQGGLHCDSPQHLHRCYLHAIDDSKGFESCVSVMNVQCTVVDSSQESRTFVSGVTDLLALPAW